jgi:hypothetical protein
VKALIFVFQSAQFTNNEPQPVKQFEPNKSFSAAPIAIPATKSATLGQGIYAVFSDNEKEPPSIDVIDGRAGSDYDLLEASGKDKWPVPKATDEQLARIKAAFPAVTDAQLTQFIYSDILGV